MRFGGKKLVAIQDFCGHAIAALRGGQPVKRGLGGFLGGDNQAAFGLEFPQLGELGQIVLPYAQRILR